MSEEVACPPEQIIEERENKVQISGHLLIKNTYKSTAQLTQLVNKG